MKRLRPYLSAFRVRALLEMQYRGAALGGVITNSFFGLVLVSLYRTLIGDSDPAFLAQTVTYVWLQQGFFRALFTSEGELNQQIMTGSVAYTMIRPVDLQLWWMCRELGAKLVGSFMRLVPMAALQFLLPAGYRMGLPCSTAGFAQFLVSLSLGFVCAAELNSLCAAITMITLDSRGVSAMISLLMAIFCGNVIPLTMFPERVQVLIRYQPFAQLIDAPIRMYTSAMPPAEFLLTLAVQLGWIVALTLTARGLWNRHLRRLIVQGG